jgi:hypothetical protein
MSDPYEEILGGENFLRQPLGARHEQACRVLHEKVAAALVNVPTTRLLKPRSIVQLTPGTMLRPDLALVTAATGKAWLVAEVINSGDHRADTVLKKEIYETCQVPRLWMIDPRYDNVEVYHGSPNGLLLRKMLAGRETLTDALIPELQLAVAELFAPPA